MSDRQRPVRVSVVGLFPESLRGFVEASILGRAQQAGLLDVVEIQIRDFADDKHRTVDDTPSGGGPGMILRADRCLDAIDDARARAVAAGYAAHEVILLDAGGQRFDQRLARELATGPDHLVLVCGRYEGFDARVHDLVDRVVSIGDYVLTGGEVAALVLIDAVARLVPGALGNADSATEESHEDGWLEHRQYTRPSEVRGRRVPAVLTSGDHGRIARARRRDALLRTKARRPELFAELALSRADEKLLDDRSLSLDPVRAPGLPDLPTIETHDDGEGP